MPPKIAIIVFAVSIGFYYRLKLTWVNLERELNFINYELQIKNYGHYAC
jgi:hypothetical protein